MLPVAYAMMESPVSMKAQHETGRRKSAHRKHDPSNHIESEHTSTLEEVDDA
jgi:hypothetical protein